MMNTVVVYQSSPLLLLLFLSSLSNSLPSIIKIGEEERDIVIDTLNRSINSRVSEPPDFRRLRLWLRPRPFKNKTATAPAPGEL